MHFRYFNYLLRKHCQIVESLQESNGVMYVAMPNTMLAWLPLHLGIR